ncbi:hypothetical protein DERP_001359 [Dermatophagoides pteronyssinus]|uniref:Uncharacterized protein n=1 Tax=Dermatophagoides pteronyssinus TaxID=6956 RepID=A0ABQ8JEA6_DERPT|nr:hypothetical protein DERP_001359 [Dermatophagoides pteronyssinus]
MEINYLFVQMKLANTTMSSSRNFRLMLIALTRARAPRAAIMPRSIKVRVASSQTICFHRH